MYRTDKFRQGERLIWNPDYSYMTTTASECDPHKQLYVKRVIDLDNVYYDSMDQGTWHSVGHTQHLVVTINGEDQTFSGAFFLPTRGQKMEVVNSHDCMIDRFYHDDEPSQLFSHY